MKRFFHTPLVLGCLLCAVSCIDDDLDPCPADGGALAVTLRVEKFRARPPYAPEELEEDFAQRVQALDYLLYADGRLIEQGSIADLQPAGRDAYLFRRETLPFGTYRFAVAANAAPEGMSGSTAAPERLYFVYRGAADDDYFRGDVTFEVTCPCRNEFETVLQRVHGVTRFRFENLPAEVASVEVSLDNVGRRMPLAGEPDTECTVTRRVDAAELARSEGTFVLGTFPTLPGRKTAWRLRLFDAGGATPLYDRMVTDTLTIERNQLRELAVRFRESGIEFSVEVDPTWDGSNDGGGDVTISSLGRPEVE